MKKLLFGLLLLSACSSKKDVLNEGETYLKSHLKDPASYAPIDKKIIDTLWQKSVYSDRINSDSILVSDKIKNNRLDSLKDLADGFSNKESKDVLDSRQKVLALFQESLEKNKKELAAIKVDSIYRIRMHFNYRAKNGMGALDVFENMIDYYPKDKEFIMQKVE